ncbi:hypothetical protein [Alistipes indistinctus]|uniref:hypothetical protein n=1 Tax=Alistipes indistinctus TaxID=626932 RepID=UPI00352096A4
MARNLGARALTYYSYGDDRIAGRYPCSRECREIRGVHQMCEVNDSTLYLACDTDALVELTIGKGRQARRDGDAPLPVPAWSAATAMSFMP